MTGTKYLAKPIDGDGNTPLHFAAIYGHHEIVETLLGARPKPKKVTVVNPLSSCGIQNRRHISTTGLSYFCTGRLVH